MASESGSQPNELDWFNAEVKAQADLLKAWSEYNLTMMQALELRAKIEIDLLKLRIMQDAYNDFRRARTRLLREISLLQDRSSKITNASWWARRFSAGQNLDPDLVPHVWIGMNVFLNDVPIEVEVELTALIVTEAERSGKNYCFNRDPSKSCQDAPSDVIQARDLITFLLRHSYMPRSGSAAMAYLIRVVKFVSVLAEKRASMLQDLAVKADSELKELRATEWKNIDINAAPKGNA